MSQADVIERLTDEEHYDDRVARGHTTLPSTAAFLMTSMKPPPRRDRHGRARNGSMLQMQIYANLHAAELSHAVIESAGDRLEGCSIEWLSPLVATTPDTKGYLEHMDGAFLRALRLHEHTDALASFWPKSGPRWDALGIATGPAGSTYLLVEAKSYPGEMVSRCTAKAQSSKELIGRSLAEAKRHFGIGAGTNWLEPYYQYAHRLAHIYFLNEQLGMKALLVNACFVNDTWTSPVPVPTSRDKWIAALGEVRRQLGFAGEEIPNVIDVFLPARPDRELLPTHRATVVA